MHAPSPAQRRVANLAGVLLWLVAATSLAQQAAEPAAGQPEPAPILPIPLASVLDRAEKASAALDALLPDEESEQALQELRAEIEVASGELDERLADITAQLASTPGVADLEETENELLGHRELLQEWSADLDAEVAELAEAFEQLERAAALWKATHDNALKQNAAAASLARIESTQKKVVGVRATLAERRDGILTLADGLVDQRAALLAAAEQIQDLIAARDKGLFAVNQPPIWSAQLGEDIRRELEPGWTGAIVQRWRRLTRYASAELEVLGLQLAVFIGLVLGLRLVRARAHARAEDRYDLREAERVFELPTAMALVLALSLTQVLHPHAPSLFMQTSAVVLAVAAALIGRHLAPEALRPLVVGLLVFFLVERGREVMSFLPTLSRVVLVVELAAVIGFLLWLLRPSRLATVPPEILRSPGLRAIGAAARLAIGLLAVALLADVIGLGQLAELTGAGTLHSAFIALFLYALFKALQSLLAYALVIQPLRLLRGIERYTALIRRRIDFWLRVGIGALWVYLTLSAFGLAEAWTGAVAVVLTAELSVGALSVSLLDVLAFGVTLWLSFGLARLVNFVLEEDVFSRAGTARGPSYAISSLVRYTLIFLGFLVALAAAGIQLSNLTVIAGGLGIGIGFGLQNFVNNFVSGLILLFERPLHIGDAVQLPEVWGKISSIGIRSSTIRSWDGAEVIVPNGKLVSDVVTNWTKSDRRRRVDVEVGVEYGTPARRVIDLLLAVGRAHPSVLDDPEPRAFFLRFGDSALEFMLRTWIADFDEGFGVRSDLSVGIQEALEQAGIAVPFPQRDLHLRSVSADVAALLPREENP